MWTPSQFLRAVIPTGPESVSGYVYKGLGIWFVGTSRRPEWSLIHLNSGHEVCRIKGRVAVTFPVASEIAECTEWDFEGLDGWRNRDPKLGAKVRAIQTNHKRLVNIARVDSRHSESDDIARQIAMARA